MPKIRADVKIRAFGIRALFCVISATVPCAAAVDSKVSTAQSAQVADLITKAETATKEGHPEVAVIHLKNAEALAPQSGDIHLRLGQALLLNNVPAEAEREFNIALQRGIPATVVLPRVFQAMLAQRKAQLLLNKYPAPADSDNSKLAVDTLRARAAALLQIGKQQEAVASLERALQLARDAGDLVARAQLAQDMGDRALAGRLVDEALSKTPSDSGALLLKISLLQHDNQPSQALTFANKLVAVAPNQAFALLSRAAVYIQLKQDDKALADLDQVQKTYPNHLVAIFYRAVIKARGGDSKAAWGLAQALPRAFVMSRPDIGAAVGEMANAAGHTDTAIDVLHGTIQLFPKDSNSRAKLAAIYLKLNKVSEAIDTMAPVKGGHDPLINAILAQAYARQNKVDESLELLQQASQAGFGGVALQQRLASAEISRGKIDEGVAILKRLNASHPNQPEVVGSLVSALLLKGDVPEAASLADSLAKSQPNNALGPFYQGLVYARKGDIPAAIKGYSQALQRDPKLSAASYNRGLLLESTGELPAARKDFSQAISSNPQNTAASIRLARSLQRTGQPDAALQVLTKAAASNPRNLAVYSELCEFYTARQRWQDAKRTVETYLKNSPNDGSGLALEAGMYLESGQTDTAIASLRMLAQRYPKSTDLAILLARAYAKKGDNEQVQATLRQAILDRPNLAAPHIALVQNDLATGKLSVAQSDAEAFEAALPGTASSQLLATVLVAQKKSSEAIAVLKRSLSSYPDQGTVVQLSAVYRTAGRTDEADKTLQQWLAAHPGDNVVRAAYGQALMQKDKNAAEIEFRKILSSDAYDVVTLNNLAWLVGARDPQDAEAFADRALKIAPSLPPVLDTAGWIKWELHKNGEAISLLRQAHAGNPRDPETSYHLAVALVGSGKSNEAKDVLVPIIKSGQQFDDLPNAKSLLSRIAH